MAVASILLLVVSFYYSLIRGFGFIYVLSHFSVILLFAVYTSLFLLDDFSLAAVYFNSHSGLPWYYKVAASWSNGGGSFILFSALFSLLALLACLGGGVRVGRLSLSFLTLVPISGVLLAFVNGAFDKLPGGSIEGLGLNPLLVNPWVYPHPIATFASYSLIAASSILALTGLPAYSRLLASLAWALLTLALAFGGLWSYETLGWGGYWAWDPVEVAQLIPWLFLTSALHAALLTSRLYTALLALSLASVYYSFLVVRAGLSPLHSFASPQAYTAYISLAAIALLLLAAAYMGRGVSLELRGLRGYAILASITLPLYAASALVGALTPALASNLLGFSGISPPSFDSGVRVYTALLAPAVILALLATPAYFASERLARLVVAGGLASSLLTPIVLIATGYTYAPKSGFYANVVGLTIGVTASYSALLLAFLAIHKLVSRQYRLALRAAQHSLLALALLGIVLSAPYSYNQDYFQDVRLKVGEHPGRLGVPYAGYKIGGGYVDLKGVVERDKAIAGALERLLSRVEEAVAFRASVEKARGILGELGLDELLAGVNVGTLRFNIGGEEFKVYNATLKLRLVDLGNGTLLLLEILGLSDFNASGRVNVSEPLTIRLGSDKTIEVDGLYRVNNSLIALGSLEGPTRLELPAISSSPELRALALYYNSPEARQLYELVGSLSLGSGREVCAGGCLNSIPERVPRVLELRVELGVEGIEEGAVIRYDIGGELAGVKGLVPRSIIVRRGLSDYYIALYPRVYNVTETLKVTEAEIAYLSFAFKELGEDGRLALTALLVASRLKSDLGDPRALIDVNPVEYTIAVLKLYREALEFTGEPGELVARVKVVPYIWVLWIALFLAVLLQLLLTLPHRFPPSIVSKL